MLNLSLVERLPHRAVTASLVAVSAAMRALLNLANRVAPTSLSVVLRGETGTGKDVLARYVHERSGRSGPFIPVNCAALPSALAESELFGHVRGAFTGAERHREGLFEQAAKGTLFLDEIGDLDLAVQAKLLRVIEDGVVQRIGSSTSVSVDVRVIAATHHDLRSAVEDRRFREDLYHRLAGITIFVPPLRDRRGDIKPLVERFLTAEQTGGIVRAIAPAVLDWLERLPWRGNARELRQAVRRAVALGGQELVPVDFGLTPPLTLVAAEATPKYGAEVMPFEHGGADRTWRDIEREVIVCALRRHGSIRAAAAALGRPKSTLADRARRFGISGGAETAPYREAASRARQ